MQRMHKKNFWIKEFSDILSGKCASASYLISQYRLSDRLLFQERSGEQLHNDLVGDPAINSHVTESAAQ